MECTISATDVIVDADVPIVAVIVADLAGHTSTGIVCIPVGVVDR
jgi:hypothetical protein